jgi:hypothetical protein
MGIRFYCPNGHKLNVKTFQAGRRGVCPFCGDKILIPTQSTRPSTKEERQARRAGAEAVAAGKAAGTEEALTAGTTAFMPLQNTISMQADARGDGSGNGDSSVATSVFENNAPLADDSIATSSQASFSPASNQVSDPLAEKSEVVWYVRPPTGGQYGPGTSEIIRGWLAEGRISADTLVWREGWRDWQEAGSVFPQLNPALANPLAALNIPAGPMAIPQRSATLSPSPARNVPNGIIWLIGSLAILTLLVIVGLIAYLLH